MPKNKTTSKLLLALLVSLPFDYIPTLDITGITIKISSLLGIALIAHTGWRISHGELRHSLGRIEQLLLLLSAITVVSLTQSGLGGIRTVAPVLFLILLGLSISRQKKLDQAQMVRAILIGAGLACAFGMYQYFGNLAGLPQSLTGLRQAYSWQGFGFPRMQSTFLEPLYFCNFLILPIVLTLSRPVRSLPQKYRLGLLFLLVVCAFMTLSRGGLAAIVLTLVIYIASSWQTHRSKFQARNLVTSVLFLVISVTMFFGVIATLARKGNDSDLTYNKSGIATVLTHITNLNYFSSRNNQTNDDSINQRAVARNEAWGVLTSSKHTLLFGLGPGVYEKTAQQTYRTTYANSGSVPLELALNFGLLGASCFIALAIAVVASLLRRPGNPYDAAIAAYLIGVGFQSNAFSGIAITHIWVMIGLGVYSIYARANQTNKKTT